MLSELIDRYLAMHRAAGFRMKEAEVLLRHFERFATARSLDQVQSQPACHWAAQAPSPQQRERRLRAVRRFARFAAVEDPGHQVPPTGYFTTRKPRRPTPRIYSPAEIRQLLRSARTLGPDGASGPLTFATLLGLLACTGLRISEALQLRRPDLTDEGLLIRHTKFNKTRLVPLHPSARAALQDYLRLQRRVPGRDPHLFLGSRGRPFRRDSAEKLFRKLVAKEHLATPGLPRPRLHSFRHTFAVRALQRCPQGRDQVGSFLLALSTYLGHARLADTYWYLEAVPELMDDIRQDLERFLKGGVR